MNWTKSEDKESGRFFLSSSGEFTYDPDRGDLGNGGGVSTWTFFSEEAREYFIRMRDAEQNSLWDKRALLLLKAKLKECFTKTGRIRRKRIQALRDSL